MRLLVPTSILPHASHTVRAANVVLFELLTALSNEPGIEPILLPIYFDDFHEPSEAEIEGVKSLTLAGVTILPALVLPVERYKRRVRIGDIIFANTEFFYPVVNSRDKLLPVIREAAANRLMTFWSEPLTALFADVPLPKLAYYGNPDPKPQRARRQFERRHGGDILTYLRGMFGAAMLERAHLREILKWQIVVDVAANDADYYSRKGHPNASYLQNVWTERKQRTRPDFMPLDESLIKIAASIGQLGATANTFGFEYLLKQLLPHLRRIFKHHPFELHIFGAGDPNPAIAELFAAPEVVRRGFVDDIDGELVSCSSFLCVNNATDYNVGHTRYLQAWSLGCCVVAHANVRQAMPEIEHGHNAMLGSDAAEIAEHLLTVATNPQLRSEISRGGHATFLQHFTAKSVARELARRLRSLADAS